MMSRVRVAIIAAVAALALALGMPLSASAVTVYVEGGISIAATNYGSAALHTYPNYRYHTVNGVIAMNSLDYNQCTNLYLGLRNTAGTQVTTSGAYFPRGGPTQFTLPGGSTNISAGYYAINGKAYRHTSGGSINGDSCSDQSMTWGGNFVY